MKNQLISINHSIFNFSDANPFLKVLPRRKNKVSHPDPEIPIENKIPFTVVTKSKPGL